MLKEKKLEFQQELEDTIEEHKIYELFEGMMKQLIIHKPKDPVDFLIKKLEAAERKFVLPANCFHLQREYVFVGMRGDINVTKKL